MTHSIHGQGSQAQGSEGRCSGPSGLERQASGCAGCGGRQGGASACSGSRAPGAGRVQRSVFVRGLGAAAGLFALSGALGSVARAAARQQSAAAASGPGRFLGTVKSLAKGQAATYTDPASGDPALLVHLTDGRFVAYDTVCTHAGCTVEFDPKKQLLTCPCHGATFDPAHGAKAIAGPTKTALAPLAIRVDAQQNVYALDAAATGSTANQLSQAKSYSGQTGDDGTGSGGGDDGGRGSGTAGGDDGGSGTAGGDDGGENGAVRLGRRRAAPRRPGARRSTGDE